MALTEEMRLAIKLTAQDTTKQAFGSLNQSLDGLKRMVLTVAATVGSALAFRDVIATTKRLTEEVGMLTDNFGMDAAMASKLNFTLKVVGSSAEEFTSSVAFLNKKMLDALPLLGKGTDDFSKWGIKILDANGGLRATGDVLRDLQVKMRSANSAQASMALGADLLGRGSRNLTEFMKLSDAEMGEMAREAEELGQVMSEAGLTDMKLFNREMNKMGILMDGLKLVVAQAVIPIMRGLFTALRQGSGLVKAFGEAFRAPLGIIKEMVERIGTFIAQIKSEGLASAVVSLVGNIVTKVGEELDKLGPVGWAIKLLLALAAVELVAGFGIALTRAIIAAALTLPGVKLGSAVGIPAAAIAFTLTTGLLLSIIATQINNEVSAKPSVQALLDVVKTILGLAGIVLATAGAVAGLPIAVAVGVGLLIGIAAVHFGSAIGDALKDLGPRFLRWIVENIAPHLPFPLSLVGNAFRLVIPIIPQFQFGEPSVPVTVPGPARPPDIPPKSVLAPGGTERERLIWEDLRRLQGLPFAHGGIVTRPTAALIGESGPEAVIPLGRGGGVGSTINVYVSGNVTRSEHELAEMVAGELIRAMRGSGQLSGSPMSRGAFF